MGRKLFDYVIGNPPYQEDVENDGDRANPVYNKFMDAAYEVADCVELIHPARFLFNAGQTPKAWNNKMLHDQHFKVLLYEPDALKIFPNTDIKGGVVITLRDKNKMFGEINVFTAYDELNHIVQKITRLNKTGFLSEIVSARGSYRTTEMFSTAFPFAASRLGKGTGNMLVSNFFDKLPEAIADEEEESSKGLLKILCRTNNERVFRYIRREYIQPNDFIDTYNVASPEANGSGKFGEKLTIGEILKPNEGATDTFISIGKFETVYEAQMLNKYMKTKFFRALLGVRKVTQHCPPAVWSMIPLQDFTPSSDIDWSKSIHEIDLQLYRKYGLSAEEIEFIEAHVKEMA